MKRFLLLVISCMLCNIVFAQGSVIDRELQEVMKQRSDEKISIDIILKSQVDGAALSKKAARSHDKEVKRSIVVNELKRHAESTQADVMAILEAEERSGRVTDIRNIWIANTINCEATKEVIYKLSTHPDIAVIGYEKEVQLLDESEAIEMNDAPDTRGGMAAPHVIQVNADDVWSQGYTGKNVIVAVLDSGTNINHYDLKDHLWLGYADTDDDGEKDDLIHGWNYISDNSNISDDFGHGTHCAGIVCGDGTVGNTVGMAPDATLMTLKIVNGAGGGSVAQMLSGVQFAVENGADVLSMSLGFKKNQVTEEQKKSIRQAFDNVLEAGVVVCAAAGNDGENYVVLENVDYPAACPSPWLHPDQKTINEGGLSSVICVGNVNAYNNLMSSSSRGPVSWQDVEGYNDYPYDGSTTYGLIRPDICAPGDLVYSLKHDAVNKYKFMTGTSQATPGVAGVIALMLEKNSSLTPAQICEIIETTASNKPTTKNNQVGSGVIDALAAVNEVTAYNFRPYLKITRQSPTSMASGNGKILNITLTNQGKGVCENASSTLTTNDQYITITNPTTSLGTIDVNATQNLSFTLNISDETPNGHTATFTLTTTDGTLTWNEDFTIRIDSYARIVFQSSNGSIDVSEDGEVQLSVYMINKGTIATTQNTDVTLSTNSPFVTTIKNGVSTLGTMNVGDEKTATFIIGIDKGIPDQATINFDLYSTPNNYLVAKNITYEFESELDQYGNPTDGFNGWTTFDNSADGRDHPWWHSQNSEVHRVQNIGSHHSGGGHLMSETYCQAAMTEYTTPIDNFLVSPKIKATSNSKISFFARAHSECPGERFQVVVSKASNNLASDFTTIESYVINNDNYDEWKEYIVDLSDYDNEEIYVAIRHHFTAEQWEAVDNGFDTYLLHIDDVTFYDVIDVSDNLKNDNYSYFSVIVNSNPLPAPTVTATANGTSSIKLSWNIVNYAQRYNIYRDGKWLTSVASTETTYTDNNLTHNTQYCYTMTSVYSGIEYDHSKAVCATTTQKDYSAAVECSPQTIDVDGETAVPLELTIINDGENKFKSLSSYTLTCEEDEYVTITNNNDDLKVLDAGASAKKTINISVHETIPDNSVLHFNLNITSKASSTDPLYFTFDVPFEVAIENPLRAPKNIVAEVQNANSIPLIWDAAPNATSYDIYRDGTKIANTSFTMYVDNGLEKETTYCYKIKSVKANEVSDFSEELCATTLAEDNGIVVKSSNLMENGEFATLAVTFENKTGAATIDATTATLVTDDPYVSIVNGSAALGSIAANGTATAEFTVKIDALTPENHDMTFNITVETEGMGYGDIQYAFDSGLDGWTTYTQNQYGYSWEYNTDKYCIISYSYRKNYGNNGNIEPYNFICSPTKIRMSGESQIIWDVASSYTGNNTLYKEHYEVYVTSVDPTGTYGWENLGTPIYESELTATHKNFNFIETTANASSAADKEVWVVFLHNECIGQDAILVDNIKITNVPMTTTISYYNSINVTPAVPEQVNLTAIVNGVDKVNLSWNNIIRAESYNIYRNNKLLTNTTETSYTDNNLTHNTTYYYQVVAVSEEVEYSHSENVYVTTNQKDYSVIFEATPQEIDVLGLTTATISFTIFNDGANTIDATYTLTSDNETKVTIVNGIGNIEALQYGAEITKTVDVKIAKNVPNASVITFNLNLSSQNFSLDNPFEIKVNNPSRVPENLIVSSSTDAYSLTLSWDAVEGATSYNIYRGGEFVSNTSSTNYVDKGLNAGTEYCYQVTSMIGAVESDFSIDACATTSTISDKVFVESYEITENGNTLELTATLSNNSSEATPEETTATLYCNDQYVTVTSATAEVGALAVGATKEVTFTMELADNTPSNYELNFDVIVEYIGEGNEVSNKSYTFDDDLQGWTTMTSDDHNWYHSSLQSTHGYNKSYSTGGFIFSESYCNEGQKGFDPDHWIVIPEKISVTETTTFDFSACSMSSSSTNNYAYLDETFGVYVSTTDNTDPTTFTEIQSWTLERAESSSTMATKSAVLTEYKNQSIWVAIRHYGVGDNAALAVDNVVIYNIVQPVQITSTSSLSATVNKSLNMFTGTGSWATASNWSKGSVPTSTDDVIIKGNATIESGNVTVNSLVIYNENSLTINEDAKLTVNNSFVNTDADALIINDGAQLVQSSENVKATFNMGIANPTAWTSENIDGWQFAASPLTDAMLAHFANANDEYCDLFVYDGSKENEWLNYKQNTYEDFSSGMFEVGTGYLLSHKDKKNAALKGTLNNASSYSWNATFTENADNGNLANFHLLGNPFSFDMNWSNVNISNIVNGFAVLNANGSGYNYLSSGTIPVGDAFFVKTTAANPSISYGASRGERDKGEEVESINLVATGNAGSDNVIISLSGAENEGFNKLENFNKDIASIFIDRNGRRYGIANFDSDVNVVNVAFNAKHIGNYTISAQPQGEFESIILVDRFTGIETNLLLEDYNFTATSSDNHDRFIVKMVNGQQTTDNSHFAYVYGEDLIIEAEGSIQIIDMMGRVVYSSDAACHVNSNAACHVNRINVSGFENAVYVIRVVNENGVKTQKVVIN